MKHFFICIRNTRHIAQAVTDASISSQGYGSLKNTEAEEAETKHI
jgi:hypothetical protein